MISSNCKLVIIYMIIADNACLINTFDNFIRKPKYYITSHKIKNTNSYFCNDKANRYFMLISFKKK